MLGDRAQDAESFVTVCEPDTFSHCSRPTRHESGLGQWRWVIERMSAWLNHFRRVRYEKRADIHEAFLSLDAP